MKQPKRETKKIYRTESQDIELSVTQFAVASDAVKELQVHVANKNYGQPGINLWLTDTQARELSAVLFQWHLDNKYER